MQFQIVLDNSASKQFLKVERIPHECAYHGNDEGIRLLLSVHWLSPGSSFGCVGADEALPCIRAMQDTAQQNHDKVSAVAIKVVAGAGGGSVGA